MLRDAEQIARFWQAVEIFSPQPLPAANVRENVTDVRPGDPLPWQPGGRFADRQAAAGRVWRHQVFGGVFDLSRVRDALLIAYGDDPPGGDLGGKAGRGQSALFACTVGADGVLAGEVAVSRCARAVGDIAAGDTDAILSLGAPGAGLADAEATGELAGLAGRALSDGDLRGLAAALAERLGVAALLEPSGLRVLSFQAPVGAPSADGPPGQLLGSSFDADLSRVAEALRAGNGGAVLASFVCGGAEDGRVDVRREPLAVRDGCAPGRIPPARWLADGPLARSEQFAVNEIMRCPGLFAVHAPPGTGTVGVFSDVVAAIVVERGRRLAELPSPGAAFGAAREWGSHAVRAPAQALTGYEIVLTAPDDEPGLADVGARWRDRAAEADYFGSTSRLADSDSTWALISARLGDRADRRAFVERFWHGTVRGTDVLFRAGESMPAALRRLKTEVVDWPAAVGRFRTALAEVRALSSERAVAAAALARLSRLEQDCEEASSALETAEQRCADLAGREPRVRDNLVAAEELRRVRLAELAAHGRESPALPGVVTGGLAGGLSGGLRAGREWAAARGARRALRAACEEASRQRDAALRDEQALRAELAGARQAAADATAAVTALTAEMARLQQPVAAARRRWGDQVPDGPSQAETDDAALIERREKSPAWADEEYTTARTELFLAALALHKALIAAEAETFERNLRALMDVLSDDGGQPPPAEVTQAAWQSFFLVVPVARVACEDVGSLFAGLGRGSLGWLLAASAGRLAPQQVLGALWRAGRAVLAGDATRDRPAVMLPRGGQQALAKALGAAGEQAPGRASAQQFADRTARYGTWLPAGPDGTVAAAWAGTPLRVVRGAAAPAARERDDGLLVFDVAERPASPVASTPALSGEQLRVRLGSPGRVRQVAGLAVLRDGRLRDPRFVLRLRGCG